MFVSSLIKIHIKLFFKMNLIKILSNYFILISARNNIKISMIFYLNPINLNFI
jgi:hypothetical protein